VAKQVATPQKPQEVSKLHTQYYNKEHDKKRQSNPDDEGDRFD
jgi:hypothetical protein